jgi:hypothetical protein
LIEAIAIPASRKLASEQLPTINFVGVAASHDELGRDVGRNGKNYMWEIDDQ